MPKHQIDATNQPSQDTSEQDDTTQRYASAPARRRISANPTDVICGRGFHIVNHRGNLNLHLMVNGYRDEYLIARRSDKRKITHHVLDEIKSTGARFIRKVADGRSADEWEEVDDETAFKKVSHALRLRTKNESNREGGPMAAAGATDRKAGVSADESDQQKPRASTSPEVSESVINGSSNKSSSSSERSPYLLTQQSGSPIVPTAESAIGISFPSVIRPAVRLQHELPIGHLNMGSGFLPYFSYLTIEQRLQYEANQQAYWNMRYASLMRSQDSSDQSEVAAKGHQV